MTYTIQGNCLHMPFQTWSKQPLLHQFLVGIPESITKQLRVFGEVTTLDTVITHAKSLMKINSETVATFNQMKYDF